MIENALSVTLVLDVVVKVALLMLVFWLGSLAIRRRSAAAQHRWWALGFAGCLLIPAITFVTPTWTLPIFPESTRTSEPIAVDVAPAGNNQALTTATADIAQHSPLRQPSLTPPSTALGGPINNPANRSIADTKGSENTQAIALPATTSVPSAQSFSWTKTLLVIWIIGVVSFWLRLVWQHALIKRLLNNCTRLNDEQWQQLLANCSHSLGLKQKVSLLVHQAAHSPVSAGVWHPVVILPEDAESWDPEQRRLVLLHELAHVARRDVLTQMLAGFACGLFWFNPICWYGLFQMRKLRELACDDLVLNCGQQPAGYADVLLDIARSYQHQNYSTAVGMAHRSNVENRIMAILDKTRRHVSLSRNAARLLLASAVALVCLVGTAQLRSEAKSTAMETEQDVAINEADESEVQDENVQDDLLREMRIRVLDEAGTPLKDAMLTASVWYPEGYKGPRTPKEHTTDSDGTVVLKIPKRLDILRLWPGKPGYVGEFKNFARGSHDEGKLIPNEYEFRLAKGHEIGGRIVDEAGNPVEGVEVQVSVDEAGPDTLNAAPRINMWLASFPVKTDAEGRWRINNAPGPLAGEADHSFRIKLSHDKYISDDNWGDAQRAQGVNTADLRSGDATIVLKSGTFVHGIVSDLEGNPIKKGWVVWHDEPYFNQGVFETEINADGSFRTPPLSTEEHPITVVAPGYAAQRRVVKVDSDLGQLRFQLRPGKRIEIRFVDTDGRPVPRARVGLARSSFPKTWNRSNALHNHKSSNVPDYGVPLWADNDGVYVWDWAPEEPVRYSVGARGFAPQTLSLVAKREPHIITLAGERVVSGLVTDSVTGEPIERLQAMPVIVFGPSNFCTRYADLKKGSHGHYELPLTGSGDPDDRYRVRFEAEGYRSVVNEESYGPNDGRANLNIQLEPAPARKGRVVDTEGNPVSDAQVVVGTPTWVPHTDNGKPDSDGERIVQADSDGRFTLNATNEPIRVRALHSSGISEKLVAPEDDVIGDLRIQPWASVSGRLIQDGQPIGDQRISFRPLGRRGLGEARFQDSYRATTSSDGRFSFKRLPLGVAGSLRARLGPWKDSPLTSSVSLPLELKPGENREVVLGGEGAVLTGQVVATGRDKAPLDRNWSLNYLISRDRGVKPPFSAGFPKLGFDPSGPTQLAWSRDPHFYEWVTTREQHFVKLTPDGKLRVTGVAPGEYDLVIQLYEQPAGCLVENVGGKVVPVRVEGQSQVDLGKIEVPCRAGPRVGSNMRAFDFVDVNGRKQFVNDMKGRYVLMHVWASWCGPCLKNMPDMVDMANNLATEPVTFVGLNIDQDSAQATKLAEQTGLSWSQNYLGDDSDMARQLAISSAPTYYLIGPDGLLAAYATEWTEIKKELASLLDKTQE